MILGFFGSITTCSVATDNYRETICEVADGVLGKVKTAARNISEKALCLIETRRGLWVCIRIIWAIDHMKTKGM